MSARVRSSVVTKLPSSASMERKSGSSAFGLILLIRCNLCQRASTVAGEEAEPVL